MTKPLKVKLIRLLVLITIALTVITIIELIPSNRKKDLIKIEKIQHTPKKTPDWEEHQNSDKKLYLEKLHQSN